MLLRHLRHWVRLCASIANPHRQNYIVKSFVQRLHRDDLAVFKVVENDADEVHLGEPLLDRADCRHVISVGDLNAALGRKLHVPVDVFFQVVGFRFNEELLCVDHVNCLCELLDVAALVTEQVLLLLNFLKDSLFVENFFP